MYLFPILSVPRRSLPCSVSFLCPLPLLRILSRALNMSKDSSHGSYDKEKGVESGDPEVYAAEDAPDQVIAKRFGVLGPLLSKLFKSVEARGVERVPENQRETKHAWNKSVSPTFSHI
jgi:hypothetical protein